MTFRALLALLIFLSCPIGAQEVFQSIHGYQLSYPSRYPQVTRPGADFSLQYFEFPQANTRLNPYLVFYVRNAGKGQRARDVALKRQEALKSERVVKRLTHPYKLLINEISFQRYTYRSEEPNGLPTICTSHLYYDPKSGLEIEAVVTIATKGGLKYRGALESVVRTFKFVENP